MWRTNACFSFLYGTPSKSTSPLTASFFTPLSLIQFNNPPIFPLSFFKISFILPPDQSPPPLPSLVFSFFFSNLIVLYTNTSCEAFLGLLELLVTGRKWTRRLHSLGRKGNRKLHSIGWKGNRGLHYLEPNPFRNTPFLTGDYQLLHFMFSP